jgi:GAF domain-containing protein
VNESGHRHPSVDAALQLIIAAARRGAVVRRFVSGAEQALLQSIVNATVRLFDAEAASIALFEHDPDRLEFRVAAGEQGQGAIGLSVKPTQGIAGYVFSTAQPLALSDVGADPRFDRATAERTGYVPRSIAAVPLLDQDRSVGVLQVLDKRSSPTFTMQDMELMAVFADQAAHAIAATRVQHELGELIGASLRDLGDGDTPLTPEQVEAVVRAAVTGIESDEDSPLWRIAELVDRLRGLGEREQQLVADMLAVAADYAERGRRI